jgi:hypothetical protein
LARWQAFRWVLWVEDQGVFDQLFLYERTFADAASMAARASPSESIFLSMLLGLVEEVAELRDWLRSLQGGAKE